MLSATRTSSPRYLYAILYYNDYKSGLQRGFLAKSVARRLNFVYYSKISIKSNKPSSKPSKPTVSTYQAKQASFRCEKFQASKPRLSGLACLLNSKSGPYHFQSRTVPQLIFPCHSAARTLPEFIIPVLFRCLYRSTAHIDHGICGLALWLVLWLVHLEPREMTERVSLMNDSGLYLK